MISIDFYLNGVNIIITTLLLTFLVLLIMRRLKIPLYPTNSLGKSVERTQHFIVQDGKESSRPRMWKLDRISELNENNGCVRAICGECKDYKTVEKALESGASVEIVCGPKMWNDETKKEFVNLMKNPSNNLKLYMLSHRPLRHATRIGNNLLLEDPHEELSDYDSAILIKNAQKKLLLNYDAVFEVLKSKAKLADISDVENMGTYT